MSNTQPESGSYRAYRAACPGCGAPVEFRSAQATHAVCQYCSSTLVRSGEQLARVGKMAELFEDHSPLQLFASGVFENQAFTVLGRLQYGWQDGTWSEWYCIIDSNKSSTDAGNVPKNLDEGVAVAYLSEDNGQYVWMREIALKSELPPAQNLRLGMTTALGGVSYQVTANRTVYLKSAAGELPRLPPLNQPFGTVELRNEKGQVVTLEYLPDGARAFAGVGINLSGLQLKGLRDEQAKEEKGGRQFSCPNCGAAVQLALGSSKTITCGSCNSVIDTSQGAGKELLAAKQDEPVTPLISLGSVGELQGTKWQVVGFQHRIGTSAGDDESFGWDEYLLYHPKDGFSFLVDSTDGWSLARPTGGAPAHKPGSSVATYLGKTYHQEWAYRAETTYVLGEFFWRVKRGDSTQNIDFKNGLYTLSREQSADEIVWSRGDPMDANKVAAAFKLKDNAEAFKREDVAPFQAASSVGMGTVWLIVLILVVILLIAMCSSRCDPRVENCSSSSYRSGSSGSGWGGGGHK
jgi:ribosomal protein S27E